MSASELAHRAMLREVARREHPKRHILLQLPRHRARGERARRVGIDQHLDHHRRLVRGVAPAVPLVRRIERRQVQRINHVADVVSEVTRGNPLLQVRRQKQGLVRLVATIRGRHRAVPKRNWRIGSYCPLPPIHPQSIRYLLRRADFSAAQAPRHVSPVRTGWLRCRGPHCESSDIRRCVAEKKGRVLLILYKNAFQRQKSPSSSRSHFVSSRLGGPAPPRCFSAITVSPPLPCRTMTLRLFTRLPYGCLP